jgi:hypothetical protein
MASKLGWINLYEVVSASFIAEAVPATNQFGWRVPAQHAIGNRIAWVPGDPSGVVGNITGPRNPGGYPRSLMTLNETFTIWVNGYDPSAPEVEAAQYAITRYLYDAFLRAVYKAAHGAFYIRAQKWDTRRVERRHGAVLQAVCELQATVPDLPYSQIPPWADAPPDTEFEVEVNELDVTETITAP